VNPPTPKKSSHAKGYGKRWQRFRKQVIADHIRKNGPFCACGCGQTFITGQPRNPNNAEVDHIKAVYGADDPLFWQIGNHQVLRKACHSIKTVAEDGGFGQTHPSWIPVPISPVTIVTGAPGSGKNTYVEQNKGPYDKVIDLDECFKVVCGKHGHDAPDDALSGALRVRNKHLAQLADEQHNHVWFIVGAPTEGERKWWANLLNADIVHIDTTEAECIKRIRKDRQPYVKKYFQSKLKQWRDPHTKTEIGADGWPIDLRHAVHR